MAISLSTIVAAVVILLINNSPKNSSEIIVQKSNDREQNKEKIYIDLAGAVEKPDMYQLRFGARLKDVLIEAGGLSADADRAFFAKNFNLAQILSDQEKIYIPSTDESSSGLMNNNQSILNKNQKTNSVNLININSASIEELDTLPGIGKITAEKIIRGRPYQSVDQLLNKKIVGKSVYENIKDLIIAN